jgi:hypothetical protein
MTLGELIEFLAARDPQKVVPLGFHKPHSYRGYYEDLAFEPCEQTTVGAMLACAKEALGHTYTGYKGGEYTMEEWTKVWLSEYGDNSGQSIGEVLLRYMVGDLKA